MSKYRNKQGLENKRSAPIQPEALEKKYKKGSIITAQNAERTETRCSSFFKKLPSSVLVQSIPSDEEFAPSSGAAETQPVQLKDITKQMKWLRVNQNHDRQFAGQKEQDGLSA